MPKRDKTKSTPRRSYDYRYCPKPYFTASAPSGTANSSVAESSNRNAPASPSYWSAKTNLSASKKGVNTGDSDRLVDRDAVSQWLQEMFKDKVDADVIEIVLAESEWKEDVAIDALVKLSEDQQVSFVDDGAFTRSTYGYRREILELSTFPSLYEVDDYNGQLPTAQPTAPFLSHSASPSLRSLTLPEAVGSSDTFTQERTERTLSHAACMLEGATAAAGHSFTSLSASCPPPVPVLWDRAACHPAEDFYNDLDRTRRERSAGATPRASAGPQFKNIAGAESCESLDQNSLPGTEIRSELSLSLLTPAAMLRALPQAVTLGGPPQHLDFHYIKLDHGDIILEKGTFLSQRCSSDGRETTSCEELVEMKEGCDSNVDGWNAVGSYTDAQSQVRRLADSEGQGHFAPDLFEAATEGIGSQNAHQFGSDYSIGNSSTTYDRFSSIPSSLPAIVFPSSVTTNLLPSATPFLPSSTSTATDRPLSAAVSYPPSTVQGLLLPPSLGSTWSSAVQRTLHPSSAIYSSSASAAFMGRTGLWSQPRGLAPVRAWPQDHYFATPQQRGISVPSSQSTAGSLPSASASGSATANTAITAANSRGTKLMVIMRGCPGSGKSTLARQLKGENGVVLSADDFFMKDGQYCWEASRLSEAHKWNRQRASLSLAAGITPVIIDNTNTMKWEMSPYVGIALDHGYNVELLEPETQWKFKASELARQTSHGVSIEHIQAMLDRYEHGLKADDVIAYVLERRSCRQSVNSPGSRSQASKASDDSKSTNDAALATVGSANSVSPAANHASPLANSVVSPAANSISVGANHVPLAANSISMAANCAPPAANRVLPMANSISPAASSVSVAANRAPLAANGISMAANCAPPVTNSISLAANSILGAGNIILAVTSHRTSTSVEVVQRESEAIFATPELLVEDQADGEVTSRARSSSIGRHKLKSQTIRRNCLTPDVEKLRNKDFGSALVTSPSAVCVDSENDVASDESSDDAMSVPCRDGSYLIAETSSDCAATELLLASVAVPDDRATTIERTGSDCCGSSAARGISDPNEPTSNVGEAAMSLPANLNTLQLQEDGGIARDLHVILSDASLGVAADEQDELSKRFAELLMPEVTILAASSAQTVLASCIAELEAEQNEVISAGSGVPCSPFAPPCDISCSGPSTLMSNESVPTLPSQLAAEQTSSGCATPSPAANHTASGAMQSSPLCQPLTAPGVVQGRPSMPNSRRRLAANLQRPHLDASTKDALLSANDWKAAVSSSNGLAHLSLQQALHHDSMEFRGQDVSMRLLGVNATLGSQVPDASVSAKDGDLSFTVSSTETTASDFAFVQKTLRDGVDWVGGADGWRMLSASQDSAAPDHLYCGSLPRRGASTADCSGRPAIFGQGTNEVSAVSRRVTFHKSTMTDLTEDDTMAMGGAAELSVCFPQVPPDHLDDLLKLCKGDAGWATNLLLDSGYHQIDLSAGAAQEAATSVSTDDVHKLPLHSGIVSSAPLAGLPSSVQMASIAPKGLHKVRLPRPFKNKMAKADYPSWLPRLLGRTKRSTKHCSAPCHSSASVCQSHEGVTLMLSPSMACSLVELFGTIGDIDGQMPGGATAPGSLEVHLSFNLAKKLYDEWARTRRQLSSTASSASASSATMSSAATLLTPTIQSGQEQLLCASGASGGNDVFQDDESFARALMAEEVRRHCAQPRASQHLDRAADACREISDAELALQLSREYAESSVPVAGLNEIMDSELALQLSQEELTRASSLGHGRELTLANRLRRQQLYSTFPCQAAAQLDDIFEICGRNLDTTVRVLGGRGSRSVTNMPSVSIAGQNNAKLADDKRADGGDDEEWEDVYEETATPDRHYSTPASVPAVSARGEAQTAIDQYWDLRADVRQQLLLKKQCKCKAMEARGQGPTSASLASWYSQQARVHDQKARQAQQLAARHIFDAHNARYASSPAALFVDLHGLHAGEAVTELRAVIERTVAECARQPADRRKRRLFVITGKGSKSRGGLARVKPAVVAYLNQQGISFQELNSGLLKVNLYQRCSS